MGQGQLLHPIQGFELLIHRFAITSLRQKTMEIQQNFEPLLPIHDLPHLWTETHLGILGPHARPMGPHLKSTSDHKIHNRLSKRRVVRKTSFHLFSHTVLGVFFSRLWSSCIKTSTGGTCAATRFHCKNGISSKSFGDRETSSVKRRCLSLFQNPLEGVSLWVPVSHEIYYITLNLISG